MEIDRFRASVLLREKLGDPSMYRNCLAFVTTLVLILSGCGNQIAQPGLVGSSIPGSQTGSGGVVPTPATGVPPTSPVTLSGVIRRVGPARTHTTLSQAVAAAGTGDTIEVDAGTYTNDFPPTVTKSLLIKGVGGVARFNATQNVPNRKAILVVNADLMLENIEISGAKVSESDGANGAAIRHEGGNLLLYKVDFHHNQNGILGAVGIGEVVIHSSRIAENGVTDGVAYPSGYGYTHNIYLKVAKLSLINSYVWAASAGHNVKSRSLNTVISHSVIADGLTGTASYSIDIPNGGHLSIENSLIEKGPLASNRPFVAFGMEGLSNPTHSISITNSVFVNDLGNASVIANNTSIAATFLNNDFQRLTSSQMGTGTINQSGSTFSSNSPWSAASWAANSPSPWPVP